MKKLTRSRTDRMIAGVMGGVGEYYATDPNIIRLGYLILLIATGVFPGIVVYIVAALIIPEAPLIASSEPVHDAEEV